ncbi:MAG: hypothetical protein GVY04_22810 [Cyanobacteria bacterium]|jgi:uncharacterized protein YjbI with pentapeptide repeats|nr:hypothetical protein [Cyanobacteria bacterium GSL.Bin1]
MANPRHLRRLRQGVEEWNRWRKEERNVRPNLRGANFKGKNLSGTDFSNCDIRGANFAKANLEGANFCGAKAGLQRRWAIFWLLASWVLSAILGFFSAFLAVVIGYIYTPEAELTPLEQAIATVILILILATFILITLRQGLTAGLGTITVAAAGAVVFAVAVSVAGAGGGTGAVSVSFAGAGALAVAGAVSVSFAVARAVASTVAVAFDVAVALAGAGFVALAGARVVAFAGAEAGVVAFAVVLLSAYFSWRAMRGDPRDAWIQAFAIALPALTATRFYQADLTDANFTGATLKLADFRQARLIRTRWHNAKRFDLIRPGNSYLQYPQIRKALFTSNGEELNGNRLILRGLNLKDANLTKASFIGADLSEADLSDANLSGAKLVQTLLAQTNLKGATLTGAFIEEWGISADTELDGIKCDYIHMRLPPNMRPSFLKSPVDESLDMNARRKPDDPNKNFESGEFSAYIAPLQQTLDLYHNRVKDSRVIALAFQELRENHPEAEIEAISVERRGKDKEALLLRVETSPTADTSELHHEYFDNYDQISALSPEALQARLNEKEQEIRWLRSQVGVALARPINITQEQNMGNNQSRNVNIWGGDAIGINQGDQSTLSGTIAKSINQLPDSTTEEPGIKELLVKLQTAIANEPTLNEAAKEKALSQVDAIAKAAQNPEAEGNQERVRGAIEILKTIGTVLSPVASLAATLKSVVPAIAKLFGLS